MTRKTETLTIASNWQVIRIEPEKLKRLLFSVPRFARFLMPEFEPKGSLYLEAIELDAAPILAIDNPIAVVTYDQMMRQLRAAVGDASSGGAEVSVEVRNAGAETHVGRVRFICERIITAPAEAAK